MYIREGMCMRNKGMTLLHSPPLKLLILLDQHVHECVCCYRGGPFLDLCCVRSCPMHCMCVAMTGQSGGLLGADMCV
jgi:hypothetical protein